jgi:small-conductance mechanosensitive channel
MFQFLFDLSVKTHPFIWNSSIILFSFLLGYLIKSILFPLIKKYSIIEGSYSIVRSVIKHFRLIMAFFIPLLIMESLFPLMKLSPRGSLYFHKLIEVALVICFSIIIIRILRVIEDYLYFKFDVNKADNLKERKVKTQIQFLRKLLVAVIIVVTIAIILLSFESMRVIGTGLLTGVGVGGIIIGFAAQKSLGNLLAGFQIAFTQPFRIDDVLIVEGEWGKVEEITLTYVVVNIWDKRRLVLPIQYFIENPFQNWTRTTAEILGTVFIYADFTIPVGELRNELSRLLRSNTLWDGKVDVLQVTDLKERVLEIRCLMSCRNSGDAFDLRCYVREHMIYFIKNNFPETLTHTRITMEA